MEAFFTVKTCLFLAVVLLAGVLGALLLRKTPSAGAVDERPLSWLLFVLPFASGGFYTYLAVPVSGFLLGYLILTACRRKQLQIYLSDALLAVIAVVAAYGLTAIWAADRGLAVWGMVRYFPVLLYVLGLLQLEQDQLRELFRLVPLGGVVMTVLSFCLQFIPACTDAVTVDGRLAGFFEYPNTFAAFLLCGLVIAETEEKPGKWSLVLDAVLILGVFESGSRTAFALMIVVLAALCICRRGLRYCLGRGGILLACVLVSLAASRLELNASSSRYLTATTETSTLLCRLLYFKDALGVIASHPFGLGYMGYFATQGSFQTGVYSVLFVHNELLQLLLDIGWLPVLLLCIALLRSFFARGAGARKRLLMLVILGHSMMDFDLQFLAMWLLLLPLLTFHVGKPVPLRQGKIPGILAGTAALLLCLWLGTGDFLYTYGMTGACLQVTPFQTTARMQSLTTMTDLAQLDETADEILRLNDHAAIAYNAKANAAYGSGNIGEMMVRKEQAIACDKYTLEEYCDYFDKLEAAMERYEQLGDGESAQVCRQKLLSIPDMLDQVAQQTDPLAWKLEHKPELELPEDYQRRLQALQ